MAYLLFILGLIVGHTGLSSADDCGCPDNYEERQGVCYRLFQNDVQWMDARSRCLNDGAKLAEPQTCQDLIYLLGNPFHTWQRIAVGITDRKEEGKYVYDSTGDEVDLTWFWAHNEPAHWGQDYDCAFIANDRHLKIMQCNTSGHFICEKPCKDDDDSDEGD